MDGPRRAGSGNHNVRIDLVPNPDYHGKLQAPRNKGLRFEFCRHLDTAYATCCPAISMSWTLIPPSALTVYRPRYQRARAAINQTLDTCCGCRIRGEEAPVGAVGRHQPAANLPADLRRNPQSGPRFTARSLPGFDPNLPGNEVDHVRSGLGGFWAQADAISPRERLARRL